MAGRFKADNRGQIAVIFGLASTAIFVGVGAGIDLASAYAARQRLSEVATLTCQYSTRPSVINTANSNNGVGNNFQTYLDAVNTFASQSLTAQHVKGTGVTGTGGGTTYFTATAGTTSTVPTNAIADLSSNVPTSFLKLFNVKAIPVHARVGCQPSAAQQIVTSSFVLQEGFENPCATYCNTLPNGAPGILSSPTTTFNPTPSYLGSSGFAFYVIGYCLETDSVGVISSTVPEGTHSAELDCDNNTHSAGNSSITAKVFLAAGHYELRYNYRSRVDYPNYDPAYICGSTLSDVSWANDTNALGFPGAFRTNEINVYLDQFVNGSPPLHTTLDGTQQLAGSNLIDTCVYSPTWIERSVKITVTTSTYYWLSFAADGANDSYGGQIDNLRLCSETCPTSLQDNFPSAWLPTGGVNKVLFEDPFTLPPYLAQNTRFTTALGNMNLSTGTSGAASGWPNQSTSGWATAPYNQTTYVVYGSQNGIGQYVELDGCTPSCSTGNRSISRPFLLDPGYYQVSYYYNSMVDFTSAGVSGTYCFSAPASGSIYGATPTLTGNIRYYNTISTNVNTNIVGVFMAHSQLISTPIGGGTLNSTTQYTNPSGTVSTTPTNPPDAVNWANYNASQLNPVIDTCGYSSGYTWQTRTVSIKITKPGMYWLTFSANGGTSDGYGGAIDDPKLIALGSPYMANPPTSALTPIPVPSPQPDTTANSQFTGFYTVADPFMPPAADQ